MDTFSPKKLHNFPWKLRKFLPQYKYTVWKFLPHNVRFRNNANCTVNLDLIYTHLIDHHQISLIPNLYNAFVCLRRKKSMGWEKIFHVIPYWLSTSNKLWAPDWNMERFCTVISINLMPVTENWELFFWFSDRLITYKSHVKFIYWKDPTIMSRAVFQN